MKYFKAKLSTIVLRFYLMMAVVLIAGFTGLWWLAVLALPIFLSCMLCVSFSGGNKLEEKASKVIKMKNESVEIKAAV